LKTFFKTIPLWEEKGRSIIEPAVIDTIHANKPPQVCPKPYCYGATFIRHEDGWQCLNCMKVIYRHKPVVDSNKREPRGSHCYKLVV